MNLNKSAISKAVGLSLLIGIVTHAVLSLVGVGVADAVDTTGTNEGILGGTGAVNTIVMLFLMVLYGWLYGYFARREGTPVDGSDYATGGALTSVAVALTMLVLGLILGAIGLSVPGVAVPDGIEGAVAGLVTLGAIATLVLDAALGAIGGGIYATTHRNETARTTGL